MRDFIKYVLGAIALDIIGYLAIVAVLIIFWGDRVNKSKKHKKHIILRYDAKMFDLYQIRKRNKAYLYTNMKLYTILLKKNRLWKEDDK